MFSAFERKVAWRYLRARRAEGFISVTTWFSLSGIALGVATLIVITSVMNGVKGEMLKHFIGVSGHVNVYASGEPISNPDDILPLIKAVPGVKSAVPVIEGQVMVTGGNRAFGASVTALKYDDLVAKRALTEKIVMGDLEEYKSGYGVIIGQRMAESLGVNVGDSITLISPEGRQTLIGMVPRIQSYPIAAIFKLGMYAYDAGLVLMPFDEAQVYFKLADDHGNRVSSIEVMAEDDNNARALAQAIQVKLGPGFRVYDWLETNHSVLDALTVQRNVMFFILMLIIVVAAFNIISSLIMMVKEKGRGIAILRTMGATRGMVQRIFILSGMLIGIGGTAAGVVLGLVVAVSIDNIRVWIEKISDQKILAEQLYFLSTLPSDVNAMQVVAVAGMSLMLSLLATLYPAYRAASLNPVEALRYE